MKILLCEPLVRRDCAAAQSFYVGYVVNERGKEDMKQKQKSFGKRLLSMFLTAVLLLSGITVPVQADNSQGEAAAAEEKPHVYFQYDDGRTQEMDENNTFTLTALDKGTFVLEGVEGAKPEWNFSQQVEQSEGGYQTHYWIQAYTGRYQPRDVRKVSGNVTDQNNGNQVYQSFTINQVSSNIEELKAFVDGQEVSDEKPLYVDGSTTKTATLKARVKGSNEFVDVDATVSDVEVTYGPAISMTAGKFRILGEGEIGMKICMPEDMKKLAVNFKVISGKVHVQSIDVKVPNEWKIKKWDSLDGLCYIGIMRGNNPTENFNYSIVPENASNQKLVWEALTPDIAEYVESFDRGLVPKKAGVAKFHVYSEDNPKASQDVSVEFKYEYPLKDAKAEQDSYTFEEGSSKEFKILTTPSNATEQRYNWSYSKEGIATVSDVIETATGNVNLPHKTKHYIKALKAGEVTVTGVPYDTTAGCKPVQFTVEVTKDGVVPDDTDYLAMAKNDIQHGLKHLGEQSLEKYGNEWDIFTILRSGGSISKEKQDAYYKSVSEKLKKGINTLRATDIARVSITLAVMGKDVTDVDGVDLMKLLYNDELKTKIGKDTSNAPIWALIGLDCQNTEIPSDAVWTREKLIKQILTFQTEEGAFGLSDNKSSSIDMTAMALQALAPYYNNEKYPEVKKAVDKTLEYLKGKMTQEGGFTDGGKENSCTTAQVLTAIAALKIDPLSADAGFVSGRNNMIKNLDGYKAADKGFFWQKGEKKPNVMASEQVTYALEAYRRFAEQENSLYDLTDIRVNENQIAADKVIKKIEAIGDKITLEGKAVIEEARTEYDKLTDAQKKLVTNYDKLTKAEKELQKLEEQQKEDEKEAKAVVEKINAIGDKVTLDSKKAIEEARTEYDKLTDAQKKLVTNYDKLTKAEKELQKLEENQNGWKETEAGWVYYENGKKVIGWLYTENHWYYLNDNGIMETGWVFVDGHWYYMNQWGAMEIGWVFADGHWYYMDQWGAMETGWVAVNGHWYYMDQWGAMETGWVLVGNTWYYMNNSGAMEIGWVLVGDTWYYMNTDGAMQTGWVAVNGYWYYLNSDGSMASSQWIGDYYVQADGSMATSTWIGGYYVDASGKWVQSA